MIFVYIIAYVVGVLLVPYIFGRYPKETDAPPIDMVFFLALICPLTLIILAWLLIYAKGREHSK